MVPLPSLTLWKSHSFQQSQNFAFTRSTYQLPPRSHLPTPSNYLSTINIDKIDVLTALSNLNTLQSPGLSPHISKRCATHLTGPITKIFQTSLTTCTISTEWKIHKIIRIHKLKVVTPPTSATTAQFHFYVSSPKYLKQ